MKRSALSLSEVVDVHNLAAAFHAAARGKHGRADVEAFRNNLDQEIETLHVSVLTGVWRPGPMRRFHIRDPKPRLIHAPVFRDRVLHHAIMTHVGPVLDRTLGFDSYACRTGKGTLAAVKRAQVHASLYEWFAQIDIRSYFASIDHAILLGQLARRFKDRSLLNLLERIIRTHADQPGRGLPIGTLTSQHFANFHLSELDRFLLETCRVRGLVRYMDDLVWWTHDRALARAACSSTRQYLAGKLRLEVRQPVRIARSRDGLSFCGFRILPSKILLSRRRRQRYAALRAGAEQAWRDDRIGAQGLQAAYAGALALTVHADAAAWRREQLRRVPVEAALEDL